MFQEKSLKLLFWKVTCPFANILPSLNTIRCQYSLNLMTLNVFSNLKNSVVQIMDGVDAGYMNLMWILMRVGFLFIYILQCMWTPFKIFTCLKKSRMILCKDSFHLSNSNWICSMLRSPFSSHLTALPMGQQLGISSSPACEHFPPIYNSQISQNQTTPITKHTHTDLF